MFHVNEGFNKRDILGQFVVIIIIHNNEFQLAPIGVLAMRMRTLDGVSRPPIDTSEFYFAHISAKSPSNISIQPLRSHMQSLKSKVLIPYIHSSTIHPTSSSIKDSIPRLLFIGSHSPTFCQDVTS